MPAKSKRQRLLVIGCVKRRRKPYLLIRKWAAVLLAVWVSIVLVASEIASAQPEIPDDLVIAIGQFDASDYPRITLYINVTDSHGQHLAALPRQAFEVLEDGQSVEIVDFAGIGESRPADIVFVFDTTGSMSEEIDGVIRTSRAFADELESKGRDYRLGLVTFADEVLQVQYPDGGLTDDAEVFKAWVSDLIADGGDEDPENDYAAIRRAAQMQYREDAQKIFILITDAPIHHFGDPPDAGHTFDDPNLDAARIRDFLNDESISVYAVAPNLEEFISLAEDTGGRYYDIQNNPDFTGMIEDIGETIANQYRITYLSPRPTYDGTRRDVLVKVGEVDVATEYHEKHLLSVQSNCLVGLCCLLPLVAGLVIPFTGQVIRGTVRRAPASQASVAPPVDSSDMPEISSFTPATPQQFHPDLGTSPADHAPAVPAIRVGPPPGYSPAPQVMPEAAGLRAACQNCGRSLEPQARYCPVCGTPVVSASPPSEQSPEPASLEVRTNCPNCGNPLRSGAKFCNACGNKLS